MLRALRWTIVCTMALSLVGCAHDSASVPPTAPGGSTVPAPVVSTPRNELVITGLEATGAFLLPGKLQKFQLSAIRYTDGIAEDCTTSAQWSSSNPSVIWIGLPAGMIVTAYDEGESQVTAKCAGMSRTITVRVDRYSLSGTVRSTSGTPIPDVNIGFREPSRTDGSGRFAFSKVGVRTINLRLSRPGFRTVDLTRAWDQTPSMTLDLVLPPAGTMVLEGEDRLTDQGSTEHGFQVSEMAILRVDTWFTADRCNFDDLCQLKTELYCGNDLVASAIQTAADYARTAVETEGQPSCAYRVKFSAPLRGNVPFRFAVTAGH